ncbi:MAG: FAD-binding protein [Candidatus Hydrogenedentota bacterium]|nr:MAG: FAD-binding protein [Candidatus Hydrogenedentota bacterium]
MNTEAICDRVVKADLLVIGSEGAGGPAAIEACQRGAKVLIATKGKISQCGASQMAGADLNLDGKSAKAIGFPGDDRDSPEVFFADIVREGLYLNNQKMVEKYVEYCPQNIRDLMDWGMRIYTYEAAHSEEMARGVITSGVLWVRAIRKRVRELGIPLLQDHMVVDLLTSDGRVAGAVALDMKTGETVLIRCRAVVLATGGWHKAYRTTSGPYDLTGDGVAMAWRAGATLISMEMVQFIPFTVYWPPRAKGSICLYIFSQVPGIGDQVHLLNRLGERFMEKYEPQTLEKSTKEIVSIATELEIQAGRAGPRGGVFFSLEHLGPEMVEMIIQGVKMQFIEEFNEKRHEFTHLLMELLEQCKSANVEVGNAAHYMAGGIKVNERTETSIPGLYAAGECSGGLWGAVRVASACSEAGVQGKIAGEMTSDYVRKADHAPIDSGQVEEVIARMMRPIEKAEGTSVNELTKRIHQVSGEQLWVIKDGEKIGKAIGELERLRKTELDDLAVSATKSRALNYEWIRSLELRNMVTCLELSARASLIREESRGEFYRSDYTDTDNDNWLKTIEMVKKNEDVEVSLQRPVVTSITPPSGKLTFQEAIGVSTASLTRR